MKKFIVLLAVLLLTVPALAYADEIEDLQKRIEKLEKKVKRATKPSAITFSGDFETRWDSMEATVPNYWAFDAATLGWMLGGMVGPPPSSSFQNGYQIENKDLMTTRFGLNMKARATDDVTVKARLLMYKAWGHQSAPVNGYFADRMMVFDGNTSHVPQDSVLRVDQAFATWSGAFGKPTWFSIGRRPSTGGVPTNIRRNQERAGAGGTPGILVDYAFDGLVIGYAPDTEALPGAYAKLCYGKGFDSGIQKTTASLKDVRMIGLDMAAYSTDSLHVEVQYNKAMDIFAFPEQTAYNTNLGDIEQLGAVVMGKNSGFNWFVSYATSKTHPNDNLYMIDSNGDDIPDMGAAGLLYDAPGMGGLKEEHTGAAYYLGARYDIDSVKTRVGAEFNKGDQYWITFTPAADDMWTSKLATRGSVTEVYIIKELAQKAVSKKGKAYFRLGYQAYEFDYTGSGNWVGAPKSMDEVNSSPQMVTPIEDAQNIYLSFNVQF